MDKETTATPTWEPMRIRYVGDVGRLVQMNSGSPGVGKTSSGADPGDVFKPPGQG